jgi:hypothetical protein
MTTPGETYGVSNSLHRICARRGCNQVVHKRTAKYCSVRCCAVDPERRERIRLQSRRAHERPLPLVRQLTITLSSQPSDPEAQLAQMGAAREDVPAGMRRLAG